MLKKIIVILFVIFIITFGSCVSTSGLNMQPEEYIMSKHNPKNNLVYFFIERTNSSGDFYAFFISNQITDDQWMNSLIAFASAGSPYPESWYNSYSPVVIQDDFNAISMAAFSFPKDIKQIRVLAQLIEEEENNINNKLFPREIELNNKEVQYYLIKVDSGEFKISEIERADMESQLGRTTNYATQLGRRLQLGFIKGP